MSVHVQSSDECLMACLSDSQCMGVNFRSLDVASADSPDCRMCSELQSIETGSVKDGVNFQMPYTHRVNWPEEAISIPCQINDGFTIYIAAIASERFGVYLHEQNCNSAFTNCAADFFVDVSFDEPARNNFLVLNKRKDGVWQDFQEWVENNGAIRLGQPFKMLLVVSSSVYVLIVEGREIVKFRVGPYEIRNTAKISTVGLKPQSIAFFCPTDC
ncbi:hypothetical protein PoB_004112300 [Plakobranchus ocellatus]|uniref:Galectin domain-containing protein n=1 Tax=Plakobranchus ocellatus TaxID=259542 RepID=A0AAV4B4W0_9GAST|nr:hypothetical protein PoB_004112300 [Plakobranchus ocellatus]